MPPRFLHATAVASSRRHSDDRVAVLTRDHSLVVVLADGAGGMRGGGAAADAFVLAVRQAVDDHRFDIDSAPSWSELFRATDRDLAAKRAGETTAIVIALTARALTGVSSGDSDAWIIASSHGIDDLTASQSRRRLGSGVARPVAFERAAVFEGVLVVASDGLFKYVTPEIIVAAARDAAPETLADALVALARLPSGELQDDIAVAVVSTSRT